MASSYTFLWKSSSSGPGSRFRGFKIVEIVDPNVLLLICVPSLSMSMVLSGFSISTEKED